MNLRLLRTKAPGLFAVLLMLLSGTAMAQSNTGSIKGFVYDVRSGEPLSDAAVFIPDSRFVAQTDQNGYFLISGLPGGEYNVMATREGHDTASKTASVSRNRIASVILSIRGKDENALDNVDVVGSTIQRQTRPGVGTTTISPEEIGKMPGQGGETDLVQYLQVVPGVNFTGDQGGQLYIRGGAPSQTGILLDGVTIYNPFHTIGLYSVFETDAIRTVEVQSAGFGAEYGNRTSAILDVRTKDGNKKRFSGKASFSPVMARGVLEGPIIKPKDGEAGGVSFLLSAKHSYLESTSKSIYGGMNETFKNGLPYTFTDLYGKVTISGTNGSKFNLFGFSFNDNATFLKPSSNQKLADFDWNAVGGGTTFVISPPGSTSLITGKFAYSSYKINYAEATSDPRSSSINGFEGGLAFTNFLPRYSQIRYGIEVSGLSTSLDYRNNAGIITNLDRRNTLASVFALFRKNFNQRFVFEPGIRLQYYSALAKFSPEPRVAAKYNITPRIRIKGAGGYYTQTIVSTKSDRDIVNFFTGFLLSPDQSILDADRKSVDNNLQAAWHLLGGIEADYFGIEFNLEPWVKYFSRTIELNRNKLNPNDPDYQAGTGKAFGLDLSAKYSHGRYFIWTAFSYQNVTNTYQVPAFTVNPNNPVEQASSKQTYPTPFDRRFNMNLLGSYSAGKRKEWELSLRYNMGSPFPFTQTQGFFEQLNLTSNGISTNYANQNGQLSILYANDINGGRLSWYHRVDISAKRRFFLTRQTNLDVTAAVTNALDRQNIFYIDRLENTRVYQLPIFPSLNVTLNF